MPNTTEFVDFYMLLQVSPTADDDVISAAYKRMALKYHPDTSTALDATQKMQQINHAKDILTDAGQRRLYDQQWEREKEKRTRIDAAKLLLDQKKYAEARGLLVGVGHPTARKWIMQIEQILNRDNQHSKATTQASQRPSKPPQSDRKQQSFANVPQHNTVKKEPTIQERASEYIDSLEQKRRASQTEYERRRIAENEQLLRREQYEAVLRTVYDQIGIRVFEWKGDKENKSSKGIAKHNAWKAIKRRRYELAIHHIKRGYDEKYLEDRDLHSWVTICEHILYIESSGVKLKRLGILGLVNYPVEVAGCYTTAFGCVSGIALPMIVMGLILLAISGNTSALCLLALGIVALIMRYN